MESVDNLLEMKVSDGSDGAFSKSVKEIYGDVIPAVDERIPYMKLEELDREGQKVKSRKLKETEHGEKTPCEKAQEANNPSMLSEKTSSGLVNSSTSEKKKEDGWQEVIGKSKKVQVPASTVSQVIGQGGRKIDAIQEISGAKIDVKKIKGSGDVTITIKGSDEAIKKAHAMITALISTPDKELTALITKYINSQFDKMSSTGTPNETGSSQQKSLSKAHAPRLQQQDPLLSGNAVVADLDDFGNLPSLSDTDYEQLKKTLDKTKSNQDLVPRPFEPKQTIEAMGMVDGSAIQAPIQATLREAFQKFVIPSFERSIDNMYQQVSDTFRRGTEEYTQQLESHLELLLQKHLEARDPIVAEMRELKDSFKQIQHVLATIESQLKIEVNPAIFYEAVKVAVRDEVAIKMRELGNMISDSVLSAMRSGVVTPVMDTPDHQAHIMNNP